MTTKKKKGPPRGKPTPAKHSSKPEPAKKTPPPRQKIKRLPRSPIRPEASDQRASGHVKVEPDQAAVVNPLLLASVNGQVVDTAGNHWGFAVLQFSLFVPSGGKPIELSTGLVIPTPAPILCDAAGNFTTALQKTDSVVPPGSLWKLTIYPFNNQISGQTLTPFAMTGPLNLSATIAAQLRPHVDPPLILPMSNSDSIGQSELNGSVYFDVESENLMIRNPATQDYVSIGEAVQTFPPAGVPVSTGAGYGPSIDPADLPRLSSATNAFDGAMSIADGTFASSGPGPAKLTMQSSGNGIFFDLSGNGASLGEYYLRAQTNAGTSNTLIMHSDTGGNVNFPGTLTAGVKTFKITHPSDETKWLMHGCLEGPEHGVFYRGEAATINHRAEVELPDYFEALTQADGRSVLITQICEDDNQVFALFGVARVRDGKFVVLSNIPEALFFWEVKAARKDRAPLIAVVDKAEED